MYHFLLPYSVFTDKQLIPFLHLGGYGPVNSYGPTGYPQQQINYANVGYQPTSGYQATRDSPHTHGHGLGGHANAERERWQHSIFLKLYFN